MDAHTFYMDARAYKDSSVLDCYRSCFYIGTGVGKWYFTNISRSYQTTTSRGFGSAKSFRVREVAPHGIVVCVLSGFTEKSSKVLEALLVENSYFKKGLNGEPFGLANQTYPPCPEMTGLDEKTRNAIATHVFSMVHIYCQINGFPRIYETHHGQGFNKRLMDGVYGRVVAGFDEKVLDGPGGEPLPLSVFQGLDKNPESYRKDMCHGDRAVGNPLDRKGYLRIMCKTCQTRTMTESKMNSHLLDFYLAVSTSTSLSRLQPLLEPPTF